MRTPHAVEALRLARWFLDAVGLVALALFALRSGTAPWLSNTHAGVDGTQEATRAPTRRLGHLLDEEAWAFFMNPSATDVQAELWPTRPAPMPTPGTSETMKTNDLNVDEVEDDDLPTCDCRSPNGESDAYRNGATPDDLLMCMQTANQAIRPCYKYAGQCNPDHTKCSLLGGALPAPVFKSGHEKLAEKSKRQGVVQSDLEKEEQRTRIFASQGVLKILRQSDFKNGTFRITKPGVYRFGEDVQFNPLPDKNWFPPRDSLEHPIRDGYFLGFFAAVAVETTNVVIDLAGHQLSQHPDHYLAQRFFACIELASRPFVARAGPPGFNNLQNAIQPGMRVVIENGILGLSSHHGIHGNKNDLVTLRNLKIRQFEVGGISLNGASRVMVTDVDIGPSKQSTVPLATLSQARFLTHIFYDILIEGNKTLAQMSKGVQLRLAGRNVMVSSAMARLASVIDAFLAQAANKPSNASDLAEANAIFNNSFGLPDGSAVYGVLFHKAAPAVHDFGACKEAQNEGLDGISLGPRILLSRVSVHDLKLRTDEILRVDAPASADDRAAGRSGRPVTGPAGDVVQIFRSSSCAAPGSASRRNVSCMKPFEGVRYIGNALVDAQLALQALRNEAEKILSKDELLLFFGGTHVPQSVLDWASGDFGTLEQLFRPEDPDTAFSVDCGGDGMSHVNKGAVGIRLEFVEGVFLNDVSVRNIENIGVPGSDTCSSVNQTQSWRITSPGYLGADSRGISAAVSKDIGAASVTVTNVRSTSGRAFGIDLRQSLGGVVMAPKVSRVQGLEGSAEVSSGPLADAGSSYLLARD